MSDAPEIAYGSTSYLDELITKTSNEVAKATQALADLRAIKDALPRCGNRKTSETTRIQYICQDSAGHRGGHRYQEIKTPPAPKPPESAVLPRGTSVRYTGPEPRLRGLEGQVVDCPTYVRVALPGAGLWQVSISDLALIRDGETA